MEKQHVLVSGAGVAGPALALALDRRRFEVTVVERAAALRDGGQAVDFRGPVHRAVLDRLGLWEATWQRRTRPGPLAFVDRDGRPRVTMPEVMTAGDVEILRGDLVHLLHERTRDRAEYRFGDQIVGLDDGPGGVAVQFAHGPPATYDLVVGADGLHSGVRALAFGPETALLRHHGYRIATFALPAQPDLPLGARIFSAPGRAVGVFASDQGARALLVYAAGASPEPERKDLEGHKRALRHTFADLGWKTPAILDALDGATDLYVDDIATVHVDRYAKGRVVLLGDAAYGGTLGGQGTSLAIVGAHVLAGELARAGSVPDALSAYERVMRPYATRCQAGATRAGSFFAPRTAGGLWLRDHLYGLLTTPRLVGLLEWMVKDAAADLRLPAYAEGAAG
jgi:2-polyprenyl-6-methoxyphenol hydroxylase-like FAD-dependent oxidoreductase